jgi:Zn-dependent protease with chaperone function
MSAQGLCPCGEGRDYFMAKFFAKFSVLMSIVLLVVPVSLLSQVLPPLTDTAAASLAPVTDTPIAEYQLPPDKLDQAEGLYRTRLILFVTNNVFGIALLVLVLSLRLSARIRDRAERASPRRFVQVIIFAPLLLVVIDVLSLPLAMYGHDLQYRYGLSVQHWGSWFWDWTKGEFIGTAITTLLIWGFYGILRRSPKRWWFYSWLASIPVVLILVFIQPMFIDPLFNKFDSLDQTQPQLLPELEKVMQRGGLDIDRSRMFEMRASDKVTTYNAYVTGIGASKRVVVWDNTSKDLTIPETLFVFGHEQGHYVLNHIWISLAFGIGGLLLALYLLHRLIIGVLVRWGSRWEVREITDWASLPAFLLVFGLLSLLSQPVSAGFSRYLEHQADVYALEVTHGLVPDSSQVAAHAFQKLGEKGMSYPRPSPLYVFWAFDHPPITDRVRFAVGYRPWDKNLPTKFVAQR